VATVYLSAPLRPYAGGVEIVTAQGATINEVLFDIVEQYPAMEKHLFINGSLRSYVHIFLDDEDIRFMKGLDTPVGDDSVLRMLPALAGG
jgi:molybdopterin synthase sulfur carrier subunit